MAGEYQLVRAEDKLIMSRRGLFVGPNVEIEGLGSAHLVGNLHISNTFNQRSHRGIAVVKNSIIFEDAKYFDEQGFYEGSVTFEGNPSRGPFKLAIGIHHEPSGLLLGSIDHVNKPDGSGFTHTPLPLYWSYGESNEQLHWFIRANSVELSEYRFSLTFLGNSPTP